MTTQVKKSGNGAGIAPAAQTKPELSNVVISAENATVQATEKPRPLTIAERKHKTELLQSLFDKQEKYQDTRQNLERFLVGSDENSQKLSLTDSKGTTFNTSNPMVIKPIIEQIKAQLAAQIGKVEDDILNFII